MSLSTSLQRTDRLGTSMNHWHLFLRGGYLMHLSSLRTIIEQCFRYVLWIEALLIACLFTTSSKSLLMKQDWLGSYDQPFSIGPRNCIGKNLAYNEVGLILARVLWKFDLELCDESNGWHEQKAYTLWEKPPLLCKVKRRT
jgi:hypothetical protein